MQISSDQELEKNAMETEFKKSNASEAFKTKVNEVWSSCFTQTSKVYYIKCFVTMFYNLHTRFYYLAELAKPDGGFKSKACKFSHKHFQCLVKQVREFGEDKVKNIQTVFQLIS